MRTPNDWDKIFIEMAYIIATRSKDSSTQVGAVLVNNKHIILSCGFNGPPNQLIDELVPWEIRPEKYDYIIHAEENALLFALGSHGQPPINNSSLYCTHEPCPHCVLRAIRLNVGQIIYPTTAKEYPLKKYVESMHNIIDKQHYPKIIVRQIDI